MLLALLGAVPVTLAAREVLAADQAPAAYEVHPGDDLFGKLKRLRAGDRVVIHAGTYRTTGRIEVDWQGTATAPIVIRGAPGEARPVIVGTPAQNIINISGRHFTVSHIEFRGGSHGLRLGDVSHASFSDLVLHDLGDVGISCNRPGTVCDAVTIRDSEIFDTGHQGTGEGIYVGCQPADCVFKNGVIERNVVHNTGGSQGDGIEVKPGSYGNIIRQNLAYRTRYPGITIWGCDDPADKPNLVEDNVAWMDGAQGIWLLGRAVMRANTVVGSGKPLSTRTSCLHPGR